MKDKKILIFISIIIIILVLIILSYFLFFKSTFVYSYSNNSVSFKYDKTWKIQDSKNNEIELLHNSKSKIKMSIITLDSNNSDKSMDILIDSLLYNIEKQNKNYKLISKRKANISSQDYECYKVLYENNNNQAMVVFAKNNEKIAIINYISTDKYFDILLDSVNNIIYSLNILDKKIILSSDVKKIETTSIKWNKDSVLGNKFEKTNKYEIFNNHYHVIYSVPAVFKTTNFNTMYNYFNILIDSLKSKQPGISFTLNANIYKKNIIEFIEDDITSEIKLIKDSKYYKDVKIENEKINDNKYIYKFSYTSSDIKQEQVYIIFSLDKLRSFCIEIKSNTSIPKEFIDLIKIDSSIRYADHVYRNIKDEYLLNSLKYFIDPYKNNEYYDIILHTPEKYTEIDYGTNNKYEKRYFGLEYDENNSNYKYMLSYGMTGSYIKTIDEAVEYFKKNYSFDLYELHGNNVVYVKDFVVNNKTYKYYISSYQRKEEKATNIYNQALLLHQLDDGRVLYIKMDAKNDIINLEMIEELLLIDIEKKQYID